MDCYISKRKHRCKNNNTYLGTKIPFKYQLVNLSFVFKNYHISIAGEKDKKQQIIIIEFDLLFPESKQVIIVSKKSLFRKIQTNLLNSYITCLTFSQFDTKYTTNKIKDVVNLRQLGIKVKKEDIEPIFKNCLIIDETFKSIYLKDTYYSFRKQLKFINKVSLVDFIYPGSYRYNHKYSYLSGLEIADLDKL
jgi:hypothetical protein